MKTGLCLQAEGLMLKYLTLFLFPLSPFNNIIIMIIEYKIEFRIIISTSE